MINTESDTQCIYCGKSYVKITNHNENYSFTYWQEQCDCEFENDCCDED